MSVLKCKICGGDMEVSPDKSFGTCEYCGTSMTLPKVSDEQRAALFNRGNHFRRTGEFDKALAIYENIVREDDTDAEAHWCCVLCRFGIEYVEDPNTFEYVPTCHRASFDSIMEDVDYLAAVENSDGITRRQYQKDAAKIAEVQKGILATSRNEEPFDVFICYKETDDATKERTKDSIDAQEIYYQLTNEGYRVFFSRITLEDKVGAEYEPYIFAALNSSKVMVVIGSKPEYFNAVWVRNEWSRFLAMMRKDRSKLLLPCYKGMDPYDLPEQLSVLQSYDMTKIGFMQDLIWGIKKVVNKDEPQQPGKETVVVNAGGAAGSAGALLKRGFLALEDGEWQKADDFFEQALNIDAELGEAYLGKLMAELHVRTREQLGEQKRPFDTNKNYLKAARFGDDALQTELQGYVELIQRFTLRRDLYSVLHEYSKLRAKEQAKDEQYDQALSDAQQTDLAALRRAYHAFRSLGDYRDAKERAAEIRQILNVKARETAKLLEGIISIGEDCTIGLKSDRTVVATKYLGDYYRGQCEVSGWTDIVAVSSGYDNTVGLKSDGTVVAVGSNDTGRCEVSGWTDIVAISAGSWCTVGLKSDGTVVATKITKSHFDHGQCEVSGWTDIVAIAAGGKHTVGLKSDGTVVATKYVGDPEDYEGQCAVSGWTDIVAILAGYSYTVGIKSDGRVVVAGDNSDGLKVSGWTDIVAISAGNEHTVGLKSDGTVVATEYMGNRLFYHDHCEVSDWTDIVAIATGKDFTAGLKSDGTVVVKGGWYDGVSDWTDIVAIAAGEKYAIGLKSDGTVVAVANHYRTDHGECEVSDWKLFDRLDTVIQEREEAKARRLAAEKEARARRAEENARRKAALESERSQLQTELVNLKGLFSGGRRREINQRLETIEHALKNLE